MIEAGERALFGFKPDVETHKAIVEEIFTTMMDVWETEHRVLPPMPPEPQTVTITEDEPLAEIRHKSNG